MSINFPQVKGRHAKCPISHKRKPGRTINCCFSPSDSSGLVPGPGVWRGELQSLREIRAFWAFSGARSTTIPYFSCESEDSLGSPSRAENSLNSGCEERSSRDLSEEPTETKEKKESKAETQEHNAVKGSWAWEASEKS